MNTKTKEPETVTISSGEKGCINQKWAWEYGLDELSRPSDWFSAFVTIGMLEKWTRFTNIKGLMANAGQVGQPYPDFKLFSIKEMK